MTPEQARQLLGGLSAGILTPGERRALFEAALHDQALFDDLAVEMEFAAFLESQGNRAQLANRIDVEARSQRRGWFALAGALAATCVLAIVIWHRPATTEPVPPPPVVATAPASVPAPEVARKDEPKPLVVARAKVAKPVAPEQADKAVQSESKGEIVADGAAAPVAPPPPPAAAPAPAPPAPPNATAVGGVLNGLLPRESVTTQRFAAPMLASVKPEGRVSKVEGEIVTIEFPVIAAVQLGDTLDVLRGGRKLGEVNVTAVSAGTVTGKYTGETPAQPDDRVRRQP